MGITKTTSPERLGSIDTQFRIWNMARITESKRQTWRGRSRSKTPIPFTEMVWEDVVFPTIAPITKMRGLNLSLKQTKILATLLPNEIIKLTDISKDSINTFAGVLLLADVSGFTSLCEKYKGFGKSGSDKLTATLNNYLGAMVEVIYKHNGDVLKFSGDAILALWKLENHEYMYSLIHRVISCALYIQNSMGVYETDVKVLLRVKLAISAGNMTFTVIGNDNSRHYLIAGAPVNEVKAAEKACTSGEVILAFSAWGHLSPVNYEHTWKDEEHVKIIRIIYNPENAKREILRAEFGYHNKERSAKEVKKKIGISSNNAEVTVREIVDEVTKRELSSDLRTFLIPSVIQQIDADLPMEYLSEMRNISIMFINIVPNKLHTNALIDMVDKAFVIICSLVYKSMGSVNKVSLFDKDVMVLVIYGLRGFNHEGEVAVCLKCAYDIKEACCSLDGVYSVSIGVTTGTAYCGVVGHPLRREYTVMGPVVNKAARLMCNYPGKGTKSMLLTIDDIEYCDELSWKLIMSIIDSRIKFLIMTMPSRLKPEVARVLIFPPEVEAHISRLTLKGLTPDSLATLACQILNTRAIPVELERVLILKSNGNPGWCERYLISLTQSNVLKVLEIPIWQIKSLGMIIPNENKLIREQLQHFDNRPSEMAHERQGSFDNVTESTEDKENEKDKLSKQASVHKVVKEKGISHFSETYQYRRSNLLNVEDAYEDFRQRIQLVRKLPKLLTDRGKSLHDLREYSERNLNTKEKVKTLTFEDERKHVNYRESITRKMKLAEQAQNESDGLPVHGKASEILEGTSGPVIDEPLKRVISEIHWRFKKSSQPVTVGYQLVRDNKIVLRSLTDVRDIEMARPMVSKSAENFINRSQPFKCKVETEEKLLHAIYQSNEYPPSILWKTYTQQLVEDSVKIFIRKKTTEAAMSKKKKLIVRDGNRNLSAGNVRRQIQSADLSTRELALAQNKDIKMDLKARERLFNGKGRRKDSIELAQDKSRLDRKGEPSSTKVEENKLLQNRAYRISLLFNKNEHQSRTHHHILSKAQEKRKSRVLNLFKGFKPRTDIRQSPTESYVDITNELEDNNETISAVLINPKVNIEEVTSPECFVGIIMSAFDCLGPYEQLLLKCGSVLGEKFSRKMLNIIMHNPNPYITAEAMKRLFEMRILCCGSDPNEYNPTDVCKCLCPLQITDIIDDTLPDYSYCHVLVFVYSGFRSTLYELIPLDQKREFHIRAVEFLEKEQIYCSSCAKLNRILTSASFDDHSISTQSGVSMRSSSRRKTSASEGRDSTTFVPKEDEKDQSTLLLPNILPSFQKCECLVLKADALKQLIDHSVSAGNNIYNATVMYMYI
ncbi:UNVERIFIED_CONTAM: hypothetical protein PYX00_003531 [Menopon gallinae]|uniref:Guanylate cyclase domain-containing protein n=1 Tax=Menopon gallinae TaxID=328185 RepID=A0AAW2I1H1_9NEOP